MGVLTCLEVEGRVRAAGDVEVDGGAGGPEGVLRQALEEAVVLRRDVLDV